MLAKIISAGAVMLLLAGGALASGSTVSTLHTQQSATSSERNIYAGHRNSPNPITLSALRRIGTVTRRARTPWAAAPVNRT
jgi:hypothetical protein